MSKSRVLKITIIVCLIIIVIDQLSKVLITKYVPQRIGNDYFAIETTTNTGMAFGFNSGNAKNILLSVFVLFIIITFIKNQREQLEPRVLVAISMALGGGLLDFIKIPIVPNFNIADLCICLGWLLLVVFLIIYTKKEGVFSAQK